MFSRFLVTGLMIVVLAACGGNGDNGGAPEEVEERSNPIMINISGDHVDDFTSGVNVSCISDDISQTGMVELVFRSTGLSPGFELNAYVPGDVLESGLGTYPMARSADSGVVGMGIYFDDQAEFPEIDGEFSLDRTPAEPGDVVTVSFNAEITNVEGETITVDGSIQTSISSEGTLENCFGV